MTRCLALAILTGSLLVPAPATASIGHHPLKTLCSDPTMSYCINIWTWDFHYTLHDVVVREDWMPYRLDGTAVVETFGSGWEGNGTVLALFYRPPSRDNLMVNIYAYPNIPNAVGFYTLASTGDGPYFDIVRDPVIDDLENVLFGDGGGCAVATTCHSVPEPGSLLLLATGVGGVVIVGWRRRRVA